ncbi:MAG: extracellular solute-binding protein [Clostridiales bacterium]|nr:extracellular solute-binding protein [Clostridiales bacterium]
MKFIRNKKVIGIILILVAVLILLLIPNKDIETFSHKYEGIDDLKAEVVGIGRDNTYMKYLDNHTDASLATQDIPVNITKYSYAEGVEILQYHEGVQNVLHTLEDSYVEWQVDIPESGLYQVYMEYYPVESRGVDIERKFYINGNIPFVGADTLTFTRLWTDRSEVKQDNQGNDIRPGQIEMPNWTEAYFKDYMGYFAEPYMFFLEKGRNTIALEAVNEPIIIKTLTLCGIKERPTYTEYRKQTPEVALSDISSNYKKVIQGEDSYVRSSPSLYATFDRSSAKTEPYSVAKIRLNMGGGYSWRVPGQWIEWKFDVPEDGYYKISIKGRQNYQRGFVSNRSLYIDGVIPFEEVKDISFKYSNEWEGMTLADEKGVPYEFYLSKGEHSLRLEVTLGSLGQILNELEDIIYRLNAIYRKIIVLTGTNPDRYRDYNIHKVYPEVITAMDLESKRLYKLVDEMVTYAGEKASQVSTAQTLAEQLEKLVKRPDKIPKTLANFKSNISSLGTTVLTLSESPLDIDSITITGLNAEPDPVHETFLAKFVHEVKSFITSFIMDYDSVGDVYDKDEAVEVWITTGRDQSTVIKTMIDDSFTHQTGIKVNVKLIEAGTLLNAVIAGTGPDIALSLGQGEPVNYALRNAVEDITQFEDYKDVLAEFHYSSYEPFKFEGGIYGVPETQSFNLLFYRTDIMEELGLDVPQTWDELIDILPTIQQNNMNVAVPSAVSNDLSAYYSMLYQSGGSLYDDEGKSTVIDSESGVKAFELYTKLYNQYSLPTVFDFVNRFRSGEIPLGIQNYGTYNTLVVFAPEIRGLWDFTLLPGTVQPDGNIDRSGISGVTCSIMLKQKDDAKKQKAWEFLKWWVSADTQVRFGREMESILGASARYATANLVAFEQLAWSSRQMEAIKEQWQWTKGFKEVAGGYYTSRHVTNAIRKVINQNTEARETLLDYSRKINEEISKKRLEFGLDIH